MPTVEARTLGRKRALVPAWSIPVPDIAGPGGDGTPRLLDLIEHVVRAEVAGYRERAEARLFLRCLSAEEIAEGASRGKVEAGGRETQLDVDADVAVATALQAFEDGMYLVLVDGAEQKRLDVPLALEDDTTVAFVRLTFLAGA